MPNAVPSATPSLRVAEHSRHRHAAVRLALRVLCVTLLLSALAPACAFAHAQLEETVPATGSVLAHEPRQFVFAFDQAVQGGLGAVRVYDSAGKRVDDNVVSHPGGVSSRIAAGLDPNLPDGTYIATYRVVSVDTHVVSGGAVFSIGHASPQGATTVAGLLAKNATGRVTLLAFGVVRALNYVTIALLVGGLGFLLLVFSPALAVAGGADLRDFARRARLVLALACGLGLLVNLLGFGLQGAEQAGVSFFSALRSGVIEEVLHTDFGTWWGLRLIDWLVLLVGVLALPVGVVRHAWTRAVAAGASALLIVSVVLSGHADSQSPRGVLIALDVAHVGAMCVWLGGLAMLALAVPRATAALEPERRSALLSSLLARFSPLALWSVVALAVSGGVEAYIHVRSLHSLYATGYGRDILAKTALFIALVALGYTQRARVLPRIARAASAGESLGAVGFLLRRVLRLEVLCVLCVLGVTAALVDYVPPVVQSSGPVDITERIGSAQLEMTVEPARSGLNEIHLYLLNARSGAPYTAAKEVTLSATLPSKAIGPQQLKLDRAGPGHYIGAGAELVPAGDWLLRLTVRVSEFEEFSREMKVRIQ
jgi:copper transport protein